MVEKRKYFLITTALEGTWKFDQPVLFLGTWCLCYPRKNVWEKIHRKVLPFHWADYEKLQRDYHYLNSFEARLLPELTAWLNKYHGVECSQRYWRILLGPWLTYFLHIVFERWESIRIANEEYDIIGTTIILYNDVEMIPKDMFGFALCMGTDKWNHYLLSEISRVFIEKEKINYLDFRLETPKDEKLTSLPALSLKGKIATKILGSFKKITTKLTKNNTYFISSTYMGLKEETLLNLRLKQLPTFYELTSPTKTNPNSSLREATSFKFDSLSSFEKFFAGMVSKQIPTCFLEGYQTMIKDVEALPFPRSPKLIFTSNFLAFDSLAMAYTAAHVDRGAKLVHGQHGGYGIPAFMSAFDHEKNIADRFLSWGMIQDDKENMAPVGILKPIEQYKIRHSPNENTTLLLVRGLWPRYTFRLDSGSGLDLNKTIDDCICFVNSIGHDLRKNSLIVRLYPTDHGFGERQRWEERFSDISLDQSSSISKLVTNSRLVIYTYNIGTGYLEYLNANVPIIVFWNMKASPVSKLAEPYFEQLRHVGIYHDTPESAAIHVKNIWNNVEDWWTSKLVQDVRKDFCERFARLSNDLVKEVETVLRNEINIK